MLTLEKLQKFLVEKAFIFPTAELYGGLAGFFDYGPLGVELKNAIKSAWWNFFVHGRNEVVGMDGSIITHPRVWEASGHVEVFHDPLVECKQCRARFRADHLVEDRAGIKSEGMTLEELWEVIKEKGIKCPRCGGELSEPKYFNLMFKTQVGPVEGNTAYLRPETAQLIFVDFLRVSKASRAKLPFGIAQIGRSFRNEISPRNFVFRAREFEQMEVEYFFNPEESCPFLKEVEKVRMNILTGEMQEKGKGAEKISVKELVERNVTGDWHAYWLAKSWEFLTGLGIEPGHLRLRQHLKEELSHYAKDTWDIEFLYPFGWKELAGIANRTDYDLKQHAKHSGRDLSMALPEGKIYPWVIEPSFGVDRLVLAVLSDAWQEGDRQLLKINPKISPVQVAVFPLVNRDRMPEIARSVYDRLKLKFRAFYDEKGSIGRRYRRQDSVGTPFCITVDGQTLEDGTVTVRERDGMKQERVKIEELTAWITAHM